MKISIITVVFNAEKTIEGAIMSIANQTYQNIEHIIIDGGSTDDTLKHINSHKDKIAYLVSEPDEGLYHAMNKGITAATGDVIGILNADDVYEDNTVLQQVMNAHKDTKIEACYADLVYVKEKDITQIVRYWRSKKYSPGLSFTGWMPAHPTLFLKKHVYEKAGLFNTDLKYQSDLEFCARIFEVYKIKSIYIPTLWVRMRLGGVTNNSWITMYKGNKESYIALKKLGLNRNPISFFLHKFSSRIKQYFQRYE